MANDEKDKHVLAATIRSGASVIVTFNLKDFPAEALTPWNVEAYHPQDYLLTLYSMTPEVVVQKLNDISEKYFDNQKKRELMAELFRLLQIENSKRKKVSTKQIQSVMGKDKVATTISTYEGFKEYLLE